MNKFRTYSFIVLRASISFLLAISVLLANGHIGNFIEKNEDSGGKAKIENRKPSDLGPDTYFFAEAEALFSLEIILNEAEGGNELEEEHLPLLLIGNPSLDYLYKEARNFAHSKSNNNHYNVKLLYLLYRIFRL